MCEKGHSRLGLIDFFSVAEYIVQSILLQPDCPDSSWLVVVLGLRPFETVFQSVSGRLSKRGRKRRKDKGE